ncbi:aspartate 1-decarboxylase [Archangium violaceum]|uniref:aspartate 1-decarboxylase n=1 Tax=Archangium violaceum TaxID=83451 RepID=UPI0037BE5BAE
MTQLKHNYRVKRSCLHNVRVTSSQTSSNADIPEGLVMPEEMMAMVDIEPFEQIIVTKIGGNNWMNRMYTFALPGKTDTVEARGSVAHLLGEGDLCCIITGTYLDPDQYQRHMADKYEVPIIDVRIFPEDSKDGNNLSTAKTVLDDMGTSRKVASISKEVLKQRSELPRVVLSNLLAGLKIETVERRGCIEMSAELPIEYMKKAGFCRNQSIFVYNASRGGASAESYVVPSLTKKTVGISGALTAVADQGDIISEASYLVTTEKYTPVIHNLRAENNR